ACLPGTKRQILITRSLAARHVAWRANPLLDTAEHDGKRVRIGFGCVPEMAQRAVPIAAHC
ncbi:MAG TPA: hypothetical protein VGF39_10650, partial [Stellaceae bacterium]